MVVQRSDECYYRLSLSSLAAFSACESYLFRVFSQLQEALSDRREQKS